MKMFDKIYYFLVDYEELIKAIFILFIILFCMFCIAAYCDINLAREKNIIENTKEYVKHKNCKYLYNIWYCWEN